MTLYELFDIPLSRITGATSLRFTTAKGDGVTDDTAAIQSDINSLPANGGTLYLPPGTFRVTSTIIINRSSITLQGGGEGTVFLSDGDYGHVFDARPDVDPTVAGAFTGLQMFGFQMQSRGSRTSGSAIHTKWTHSASFRDLRIGTLQYGDSNPVNFWDGITLENESNAVLTNCLISARHYGTYWSGQKVAASDHIGTNYWNGLITGNCAIWGQRVPLVSGSAGVFIAGGTGGIQLEQSGIAYYENGVHVTGVNRELFIGHAFAADDIGGHGILVDAGALKILQITGGWASGCGRMIGGDGIHVSDQLAADMHTTIVGGTFYSNVGYGIYIGQGDVTISSAQLYSNSTADLGFGTALGGSLVTSCFAHSVVNNVGGAVKFRSNIGIADAN